VVLRNWRPVIEQGKFTDEFKLENIV